MIVLWLVTVVNVLPQSLIVTASSSEILNTRHARQHSAGRDMFAEYPWRTSLQYDMYKGQSALEHPAMQDVKAIP